MLKTQGPDVRRIMVPDARKLDLNQVGAVISAGSKLRKCRPLSIHDAWNNNSRVTLDKAVANIIDLSDLQAEEIYCGARVLVEERQERARS